MLKNIILAITTLISSNSFGKAKTFESIAVTDMRLTDGTYNWGNLDFIDWLLRQPKENQVAIQEKIHSLRFMSPNERELLVEELIEEFPMLQSVVNGHIPGRSHKTSGKTLAF